MTKSFKYLAALMLIACGCFLASKSYASVCFLPDENCEGSHATGVDINLDDLASKCASAGYNVTATSCLSQNKQIGDYCPFDNKWVICCGAEYTRKCDNTNIVVDRCGTLVKCGCPDEFNYFEDGEDCRRYNPRGEALTNSKGDYDSGICYLRQYNEDASGTGSISTLALYKACLCNPVVYPRSEEYCSRTNMIGGGDLCVDSNGNERYTKCVCPTRFDTLKVGGCRYGVQDGAETCTAEDGITYIQSTSCCDCDSSVYPYDSLADVQAVASTYTKCPSSSCSGGWLERYKADTCKPGYTKSGNRCVEQGCTEAIKEYLQENPVKATMYGILTPTGVVDGNGDPSDAQIAIVGNDLIISTASTNGTSSYTRTYCTRRQCQVNTGHGRGTGIQDTDDCICTNCGLWSNQYNFTQMTNIPCSQLGRMSGNSHYGCARSNNGAGREMTAVCIQTTEVSTEYPAGDLKGLVNSRALNYISGADFAAGETGLAASNIRQSCSNVRPTIKYTASKFPSTNDPDDSNGSETSRELTFNGVGLNFSSTTTITRKTTVNDASVNASNLIIDRLLTINRGDVTGSSLTSNRNIILNGDGTNPTYSVRTSIFKTYLTANDYNFVNFNDMYFVTGRSGRGTSGEFTINLSDGGRIQASRSSHGYGIHIHPETDAKSGKNGRYLSIVGPSSGSSTVNSNLYVGNKDGGISDSRPTTMQQAIKFSGNVTLELNNGYEITLSPLSYVEAPAPAAIKISSMKAWKKCYTSSVIYEPYVYRDGCWGHNRASWKTDGTAIGQGCSQGGSAYFLTAIKADSTRYIYYYNYCSNWHESQGWPCSDATSPWDNVHIKNGQLYWSDANDPYEGFVSLIFCEDQ